MADFIDLKDVEGSERELEGDKLEGIVTRWLREIDSSGRHEARWRKRAKEIEALYKDEREKAGEDGSSDHRFNILFSNTEVLKGALYSQVPVPDVRRRHLDKDVVGRYAALILQRSLSASLDQDYGGDDFDSVVRCAVLDMVLPGRGVSRENYMPVIEQWEERINVEVPEGEEPAEGVQTDEQGFFRMEKREEVTWEAVESEHVEWDMFRYSPAKRWRNVRWVAFGKLLTRDDCIKQFGNDLGRKVELKWMPDGVDDSKENETFKRALVWVIWNKTKREVVVVSEGYKDAPLKVVPDPLRLSGFFPMPRPLYSVWSTTSLIPVPEYTLYQDHALQLDLIEERIAVLTEALRRRGVYDAAQEELEQLVHAGDNDFVPVKNYKAFMEKGGLDELFKELPLEGIVKVLAELMKQADAKKAHIYEIIGISDIMRGATKAQETLGAQKIKDQWGSVRVGPRQQEIQRYARDMIRIKAEIMSEHFSAETLAQMSGVALAFTPEEREQIKQQNPKDERAARPTWADVITLLRDQKLRGFRIDIETDSTVKHRADDEQKNRVELTTSITSYLEKALPAVQSGLMPKKLASELLMFAVRAFPHGPQLEELLDEWAGTSALEGGEQPNPEVEELKAKVAQLQPMADENNVKREEQRTRLEDAMARREEVRAQHGIPHDVEQRMMQFVQKASQSSAAVAQAVAAVRAKLTVPREMRVVRAPESGKPVGIEGPQ